MPKNNISQFAIFYWVNIFTICMLGVFFLRSFAKEIFPQYYFYYLITLFTIIILGKVSFNTLTIFSKHLYVVSIVLLGVTFVIGEATRGAIRWIPIWNLSFQPSEIVRPFIYLYVAKLLTSNPLNNKKLIYVGLLILIPIILIFFQPSLGVAVITTLGFFGIILSSGINKSKIIISILVFLFFIPIFWVLLKPYQKERISSFIDPEKDALGAGYNSIQSMISMGSGSILGRGFGRGVQTQLNFLPEKQTDFVYASIGEEFGFLGILVITIMFLVLFFQMTSIINNPINPTARAFVTGILMSLLAEFTIHVNMNMGIFPITGVPLIMISAGGSSFLSTLIGLSLVSKCRNTG